MEKTADSDQPPGSEPHSQGLSPILFLMLASGIFTSNFSILLLVVLALIVLSALVSASEVAYFSLTPDQIKSLEDEKSPSSKRLLGLLDRREYLLATILIANNLFNVGIILSSYMLTNKLLESFLANGWLRLFVETILITGTLVVFGEVLPKLYAKKNNLKLARFSSYLLAFLSRLFSPISHWLVKSTAFIQNRLARNKKNIDYQQLDEAIDLVARASNDDRDWSLLKGVLSFGTLTAKQVMRARVDVVAIEMEKGFDELCELVISSGYSRIPVFEETLDEVTGLIYAKDLLRYSNQSPDFDWTFLIRTNLMIIPEARKIDDLLQDFREEKKHLAIVVDEYGGTNGIITLEDVLEEVVGDIEDEYDKVDVELLRKNSESEYVCDGKTSLLDLCRFMAIENDSFDEIKGDSDSVGGLLLEYNKGFPEVGAQIEFNGFTFTVIRKSGTRIEEIKINVRNIIRAHAS